MPQGNEFPGAIPETPQIQWLVNAYKANLNPEQVHRRAEQAAAASIDHRGAGNEEWAAAYQLVLHASELTLKYWAQSPPPGDTL